MRQRDATAVRARRSAASRTGRRWRSSHRRHRPLRPRFGPCLRACRRICERIRTCQGPAHGCAALIRVLLVAAFCPRSSGPRRTRSRSRRTRGDATGHRRARCSRRRFSSPPRRASLLVSSAAAGPYQWLLDGAPIAGANGPTFVPPRADDGHLLSCAATSSLEGGSRARSRVSPARSTSSPPQPSWPISPAAAQCAAALCMQEGAAPGATGQGYAQNGAWWVAEQVRCVSAPWTSAVGDSAQPRAARARRGARGEP